MKRLGFNLLVILVLIFSYSMEQLDILNKEVVPLENFMDYYPQDDSIDDGEYIIEDNFFTVIKEYNVEPEVIEKAEDEASETSDQQEEREILNKIEFTEYSIVKGDTTTKIAEKFKISENVLRFNNPGLGKTIKVGQKLRIPSDNIIEYKIVRGDSIFRISRKFNVSEINIKEYNGLKNDSLKIGEILYIKDPTIKTEAPRVVQPTKPPSTGGKTTPSTPTSPGTSKSLGFKYPVRYRGVSSPFGRRFHPVLKRYLNHEGVDFIARYVDVKSSQEGVIKFAGTMGAYGKIVIISHSGGYETRYAHLNKINVRQGQKVSSGEIIAQSGNSGRSTGPHLHFEIRLNGKPIDPMKYVK